MAKIYTEEELNNLSKETLMAVILSIEILVEHILQIIELNSNPISLLLIGLLLFN